MKNVLTAILGILLLILVSAGIILKNLLVDVAKAVVSATKKSYAEVSAFTSKKNPATV